MIMHPAIIPLHTTYVSYPAKGLNIYVLVSYDAAASTVLNLPLCPILNCKSTSFLMSKADIPPQDPAAKQLM